MTPRCTLLCFYFVHDVAYRGVEEGGDLIPKVRPFASDSAMY